MLLWSRLTSATSPLTAFDLLIQKNGICDVSTVLLFRPAVVSLCVPLSEHGEIQNRGRATGLQRLRASRGGTLLCCPVCGVLPCEFRRRR